MNVTPKKHGLSPLIASVLLIVFTISIATVIVTWLNRYTATTTEDADVANRGLLDCSKARPVIDNVFVNSTDQISKVAVRNAGDVNITLRSLQVFSNEGVACSGSSVDGTVMSVGGIATFNIANCNINCTSFQLARVTTTCGPAANDYTAKTLIVGC